MIPSTDTTDKKISVEIRFIRFQEMGKITV